jgi:hypothetical protein
MVASATLTGGAGYTQLDSWICPLLLVLPRFGHPSLPLLPWQNLNCCLLPTLLPILLPFLLVLLLLMLRLLPQVPQLLFLLNLLLQL